MTPSPTAAPLPPLPEYVEEAIRRAINVAISFGQADTTSAKERSLLVAADDALCAAIIRYASEAARGAGEPDLCECGHKPGTHFGWGTGACAVNHPEVCACDKFSAPAPDPRPAGCVCPVERVRREVRACPVHGGGHE